MKIVEDTWRGMERGHPCKVKGERGEFTFYSFTSATIGAEDVSWVTVIGGTKNHSQFRHFSPERIVKKRMAA